MVFKELYGFCFKFVVGTQHADSQFIKLEISDNGSKVKPTENSGHYGLAFIQERAIALGGSFKVTNQGGFSIKVKLPISIGR